MLNDYDVVVVGAGHAGCEAANAAAKLGSSVLLITMNMNTIAQMSCNPAMGGVAKGQIIREIDALGGGSGIVSDLSAIQFRMLNRSKGPAMWSPRTQNDRMRFAEEWRLMLERNPNVDFWQDMCTGLIVDGEKVIGMIRLPESSKNLDDNGQSSLGFTDEEELLVASANGFGFRFPISNLAETTRSGRKIMNLKN